MAPDWVPDQWVNWWRMVVDLYGSEAAYVWQNFIIFAAIVGTIVLLGMAAAGAYTGHKSTAVNALVFWALFLVGIWRLYEDVRSGYGVLHLIVLVAGVTGIVVTRKSFKMQVAAVFSTGIGFITISVLVFFVPNWFTAIRLWS